VTDLAVAASDEVIAQLGAGAEVTLLRRRVNAWLDDVDDELRESLSCAFAGTPTHFRPLTVFACHRAVHTTPASDSVELAFAVELMHNMSLIIDDALDESGERRGIDTVQKRSGGCAANRSASRTGTGSPARTPVCTVGFSRSASGRQKWSYQLRYMRG
jgi:hypothetical protein